MPAPNIVPHATGVERLFSVMTSMKIKVHNRLLPNASKMMAQIKLHLLQGDPLSAAGRKEFRSAPESTQYNSKYKDMKTYKLQVSLTPAKLEVFGEGIFTESQISALFRRRRVPGHSL
ncbi:hypothetical protein H4Q26_014462 [Puccinia striiformis f. sp. tritici PST-130]|nr:hypothetical protein H4Q26_014462 [Puccinia striiformis f. sp. tritici PST-130]